LPNFCAREKREIAWQTGGSSVRAILKVSKRESRSKHRSKRKGGGKGPLSGDFLLFEVAGIQN